MLTLDIMLAAYDNVWRFPDEPAWYLCHPDDLAALRAAYATEQWGTCPLIRASEFAQRGKAFRLAHKVETSR